MNLISIDRKNRQKNRQKLQITFFQVRFEVIHVLIILIGFRDKI